MPSEYDALLEEPATTSPYDALLAQPTDTPQPPPQAGGSVVQNALQAAGDVAKGIVGGIAQLPKVAYEGIKFASGGPQERADVLKEALGEAIPMGQQIAKDVQSPLGTRESFRGLANVGMLALPGLELARELRAPTLSETIASPPVQTPMLDTLFGKEVSPEVAAVNESLAQLEKDQPNAIEPSNAQIQAGETPLRVEAGTESGLPTASYSNNVVGETQGTAESGQIPARQGIEAQPQTQEVTPQPAAPEEPATPPEIPPDAKATVQFKTDTGDYVSREMNAREAEGIFTKEKSSYKALIDCLGR